MVIRFFDIIFSLLGLIFFTPFFLIILVLIICDSRGGFFYFQNRVGKNNIDFRLIKFRTMAPDSDKIGSLTVGSRDQRITKIGYYLRKFKIDELPQLINVLLGDMSLVGPRPEIRKFVDFYTEEQKVILNVKPGITDYASIKFVNENEILAHSPNSEKVYIEEIMPRKIELNMKFINNPSLYQYLIILIKTFLRIFSIQKN